MLSREEFLANYPGVLRTYELALKCPGFKYAPIFTRAIDRLLHLSNKVGIDPRVPSPPVQFKLRGFYRARQYEKAKQSVLHALEKNERVSSKLIADLQNHLIELAVISQSSDGRS